jgi:hypothetical protein
MQQQNHTRALTDKYQDARRKEKQLHKKRNKQYECKLIEKLEELGQQHQVRKFYRDMNKLRKDFRPRLTICKSKNGDIITEKKDILNRWKDHFNELLNSMEQEKEPIKMQDYKDAKEEDFSPTIEEVEMAGQNLEGYKVPATDNIPAKLFKYGGNALLKHLHSIIREIWLKEKMQTDWNSSIICPIHNKGGYNGMLELWRSKYSKHSLQNIVLYIIHENLTICQKHNWELSMWLLEEQIYSKPDIYTKTNIGKDQRVYY